MHGLQRRALRKVGQAAKATPLLAFLIAAAVIVAGLGLVGVLAFGHRPPAPVTLPPPPPGTCQFFCENPA
ncbi:hypothetical protein OHB26_39340 (plasmid) [Nocardia sp. NBC_01503]|uniref:hypothetical protein n=1 Tax=Nocardia sp. NBC_01503 TaxID=2975997 RepID=UPI002E7B6722|nr:hypothetical protein [Nocardia sp. NBC_01503]WTL36713.1 hypothetical protein OHB26_39235 [Nocardia sp. NBC_01503]WTL36734.1 hypothetical protein OHB26_39340 [Nocardia sp. NBC_01503]